MLESLHRILQEVNHTQDLLEVLNIIVSRTKQTVKADACSVYLADHEKREQLLMASDGYLPESIGQVRLPLHRGLVGVVTERAEPINLADAKTHPNYESVIETGEQVFCGFLGIPIVHHREVLGVIVIRTHAKRRLDNDEVNFTLTLATQLAGAIIRARISGELQSLQTKGMQLAHALKGMPSSGGIAIGTGFVLYRAHQLGNIPDRKVNDPEAEVERLYQAVEQVKSDLRRILSKLESTLTAEDKALFEAWLMMLGDGSFLKSASKQILDQKVWAPAAVRDSVEAHASIFRNMDDEYLRERAADVQDLGQRVFHYLQDDTQEKVDYPLECILVSDDLNAIELAEAPQDRLVGVISAKGSSSSHMAILARALGIPAVTGINDLPVSVLDGHKLILDGYQGRIYIEPGQSVLNEYRQLLTQEKTLSDALSELSGELATTADGKHVPLLLNTGLVAGVSAFGASEAEGIGLYRTEFPFMTRDYFPGEDEQYENYRRVLELFNPRPVVLRTLDIGGDKPLPYFPIVESNPFLGWRGVRISIDHPEIFLSQIRAMLKANIDLGNLSILLPMVTTLGEVDQLQHLIQRAHKELIDEGFAVTLPSVGIMIEVPAAVYHTAKIAKRVDFISIGTNDLTQYLLAVDRNNSYVAELFNDMHPAVLMAIKQVIEGARQYNCPVSVCGEMAGNPLATPLLLGLGVDSLSMSAGSLLRVKSVLKSITLQRAKQILENVLSMDGANDACNYLIAVFEELGIDNLIRPYTRGSRL